MPTGNGDAPLQVDARHPVGIVDSIIRPLVIGSRVELHPLLLLFAVLGGLQAFGFIAIFVGPVVISLIAVLTTMVREELHAL